MHQAVMLHKTVQPVAPQPALSLGDDSRHVCPSFCCPPNLQAASDASDDLEEVMRLRANILNQTGSLQVQADNLAKYYRLLT